MKISRKIIRALAEPLKLVPQPYTAIAEELGMDEADLLAMIRQYKEAGVIRRVGVVLGHFKAGYTSNALVSWNVAAPDLDTQGKLLAAFPQVTHCYVRQTYPQWPYSLYTMVHARHDKELALTITMMAKKSGIKDYKIRTTLKEFKKIKSDLKGILS
ncbi:MAG: Lrp/AsnC family transcriptional regulator [Candidatus Omnitrophota bacterium]